MNAPETTPAQRLHEVLRDLVAAKKVDNMNQFAILVHGAEKPQLSVVSRWFSGEREPNARSWLRIAEATGYRLDWLQGGKGEKMTAPEHSKRAIDAERSYGPDVDRELLSLQAARDFTDIQMASIKSFLGERSDGAFTVDDLREALRKAERSWAGWASEKPREESGRRVPEHHPMRRPRGAKRSG